MCGVLVERRGWLVNVTTVDGSSTVGGRKLDGNKDMHLSCSNSMFCAIHSCSHLKIWCGLWKFLQLPLSTIPCNNLMNKVGTRTCRHQLLPLVENLLKCVARRQIGVQLYSSMSPWTSLQGSSCSWSKVWLPWMQAMFLPESALLYRLMRENRDLCHQLVGSLAVFPVTHKKSDVHLGSRSCPIPHELLCEL